MNISYKNVIIIFVVLLTMGSVTLMSYNMYVGDYEAEELTQTEPVEKSKKRESESEKHSLAHEQKQNHLQSAYIGEQDREIKALAPADIRGLLAGSGMPFNGMAKAAELNGYPGPRHVLEAHEEGSLKLTDRQLEEVQKVFEEMEKDAVSLGRQLLDIEQEMDTGFSRNTISEYNLQRQVQKSAELYGKLRFVHLKAHLQMMDILDEEQVQQYISLRGYNTGDPEGSDGYESSGNQGHSHHSDNKNRHKRGSDQ
jgi:Spy/CpxP family protein refolding chaperone